MADYAGLRRKMVDNQLRTSGITDWRILDAMNRIPREMFVPEFRKPLSYIDETVILSDGRSMLAPATLARMIQLAEVEPTDVVLDVGCGTGYSTAVLSCLANAAVGLDAEGGLVDQANDNLAALDIGNAAALCGDIEAGVAKEAPFDAIVLQGAVDKVTQALLDQLRDGGRLVAVVGNGNAAFAHVFLRSGNGFSARSEFNASVPPLRPVETVSEFSF